jgi:hypothetical protein
MMAASATIRREDRRNNVGSRVVLGSCLAEAAQKNAEMPIQCKGCHQTFQRKELSWLRDIPEYADSLFLVFCADCRGRLREAYEYEGILWEENRKLRAQLKRAMENGCLATLTLDEWTGASTMDVYHYHPLRQPTLCSCLATQAVHRMKTCKLSSECCAIASSLLRVPASRARTVLSYRVADRAG